MHCEWQPLLGLVTRYMGDAAGRNASCVKTSLHWLAQSLAAHADPHRITLDTVERFLFATRLATVQQQYLRAAMLFGVAEATRSATQTMLAQPMRGPGGRRTGDGACRAGTGGFCRSLRRRAGDEI